MTRTLAGADVRGFYTALGVEINDWAQGEAAVSCFSSPDIHRRGDRAPSCSVNLTNGAYNCHGCGARGGAYDAALAQGLTPRAAIDLMVAFGLTEHRAGRARLSSSGRRPARGVITKVQRHAEQPTPHLDIAEVDIDVWRGALAADRFLLHRLRRDRGWDYDVMAKLGIGLDRDRITIPTRNESGQLTGLLRYRPWPRPGEPKLVAAAGSRRTLLPHPAAESTDTVLLVEGEPDMIAARSRGFAAIAIPGVEGWRPEWADLLAGRHVKIVMDCDCPGRHAAARIAHDLDGLSDVEILDLAPERDDGYDLTDWLLGSRAVEDPWLTTAEIAAELRLTPAAVRAWITARKLPAKRAGERKWLIRRSELERFLATVEGPQAISMRSSGSKS